MKKLKLLSGISLSFQNTEDFDKKIDNALRDLGKFLDTRRVYIYLYETEEILKNKFEWSSDGIYNKLKDIEFKKAILSDDFFNHKGYICIEDVSKLPKNIIEKLKPFNIKSLIIYPLTIKGEIKGFLGVEEVNKIREWKNEEIELINTVSSMIASAYEKNYFQQEIIDSENNFKNFFETIDDMFIVSNLEGKIIHFNQSLVDKTEYSSLELKDMNILELYPKDKKENACTLLDKLLNASDKFFSLEVESKKGKIYLVESRNWIGKWDREDCIFTILKDVTKENENLELFSKIFEENPLPMAIVSKDNMEFTEVNPEFSKVLGFSKEETLGRTIKEINIIEDFEKFKKDSIQLRKKGRIKNKEQIIKAKDGNLLNVILSVESINNKGKESYIAVIIDITLRKRSEKLLEESEKRFLLALDASNVGLWDINIETKEVFLSSRWKKIMGYLDDEIENSFEGWQNLWHPDDKEDIEKTIDDYMKGKNDKYESTHRLKHKDGTWRWILSRGGVLRDSKNIPYRWIGTNIDITKEEEQSLELERIFTINLDLLCILDMKGYFIKANKAWDDILGYCYKDLKNQNITEFIYKDDIQITLEAMKKLEDGEKVDCFVNRYNDKEGKCHYLEWRANPYEGLIYASARDITDRINYENKILDISNRDALTNVYNRRYVFNKVEKIINKYRLENKTFSVCILDIDHFKKINDTYGHLTGDCVLKEFTKTIDENLRLDDILGRYGGEEFIVILDNVNKKESSLIIERILDIVRERTFICNGNEINFTFSAGISNFKELKDNESTIDTLVDIADKRMYQAKETGRNRVIIDDY